jgi:hypothetical protein
MLLAGDADPEAPEAIAADFEAAGASYQAERTSTLRMGPG